jgi:hypothetical protein
MATVEDEVDIGLLKQSHVLTRLSRAPRDDATRHMPDSSSIQNSQH